MATSTLRIIDGQTVDWNPDNANAVLVKKDDGWWAVPAEDTAGWQNLSALDVAERVAGMPKVGS